MLFSRSILVFSRNRQVVISRVNFHLFQTSSFRSYATAGPSIRIGLRVPSDEQSEQKFLSQLKDENTRQMVDVLNTFSRKSTYTERKYKFSKGFRHQIGHSLVKWFESTKNERTEIDITKLPVALRFLNCSVNSSLLNSFNCWIDQHNPSDGIFVDVVRQILDLRFDPNIDSSLFLEMSKRLTDTFVSTDDKNLVYIMLSISNLPKTVKDKFLTEELCKRFFDETSKRSSRFNHYLITSCFAAAWKMKVPDFWGDKLAKELLKDRLIAKNSAEILRSLAMKPNLIKDVALKDRIIEHSFKCWFDEMETSESPQTFQLTVVPWSMSKFGINPARFDRNFWEKYWKMTERMIERFDGDNFVYLLSTVCDLSCQPPYDWLNLVMNSIKTKDVRTAGQLLYLISRVSETVIIDKEINLNYKVVASLVRLMYEQMEYMKSLQLCLGVWGICQLNIDPLNEATDFWTKFWKLSVKFLQTLETRQRYMLMDGFEKAKIIPPVDWLGIFLEAVANDQAISNREVESRINPASRLFNYLVGVRQLSSEAQKLELDRTISESRVTEKLFAVWCDEVSDYRDTLLLNGPLALSYFGGSPEKIHPGFWKEFCSKIEPSLGRMSSSQSETLRTIIGKFSDEIPSEFIEKFNTEISCSSDQL